MIPRWVVKLSDTEYLNATLRATSEQRLAIRFLTLGKARHAAKEMCGAVVKIVPRRRPSAALVRALEDVAEAARPCVSGTFCPNTFAGLVEALRILDAARAAGGAEREVDGAD